MTYQKILEKLKQSTLSVEDFACEDYKLDEELQEELGEIIEIDQEGGEGQGDSWHSVKHFPKHNVYIKIDGYYSSYEGTDFGDWDDACSNVSPKEKVITVYE